MSRVGFIGTGHIAAPMARALARDGHDVIVSERNAEVAAGLAAAGLGIEVAANQAVVDASDTVFLCLRPGIWEGVTEGLTFREGQQIVSVMAGVPLARIAQVCAPVRQISATIPLGFIESGGCPLPVLGDPAALKALFGAANPIIPVAGEAALNHHFSASTLISGVLGVLQTGAEWLGEETGNSDGAEIYVANLLSGFLGALKKSAAGELEAEKWALATEGSLNLKMVEGLAEAGAFEATRATLARISAEME